MHAQTLRAPSHFFITRVVRYLIGRQWVFLLSKMTDDFHGRGRSFCHCDIGDGRNKKGSMLCLLLLDKQEFRRAKGGLYCKTQTGVAMRCRETPDARSRMVEGGALCDQMKFLSYATIRRRQLRFELRDRRSSVAAR